MKVYYIQNEKQLKKLIFYLYVNNHIVDLEELEKFGLYGCDYIKESLEYNEVFDSYENNCGVCEADECYVFGQHCNDKDVLHHVHINSDLEYPLIVVTYQGQNALPLIVELISVREAKENSKYIEFGK